jgi:hypothetical protein
MGIPEVYGLGTGAGFVYPLWLRIEVMGRTLYRECHAYNMTGENQLDLLRVNPVGKLERFAYINDTYAVEEVSGPPEPEAPPEVSSEPTVAVAEDDMAF